MKIDVLALFPEIIVPALETGILKRVQEADKLTVNLHNLRDWATDKHKSVDDSPYGGGAGMIFKTRAYFRGGCSVELGRNGAHYLSDTARHTFDTRDRGIAFFGNASRPLMRALQRG